MTLEEVERKNNILLLRYRGATTQYISKGQKNDTKEKLRYFRPETRKAINEDLLFIYAQLLA